ncbi:unnamed protein product [Polarella glacialis]|uniref:Uncharacterized protein n=1 Tax=Polarella glacialis TaxID=89957 RepID=A0A813KMI1_POLGL|nr:unnamed protein product [Polarella glacialis]
MAGGALWVPGSEDNLVVLRGPEPLWAGASLAGLLLLAFLLGVALRLCVRCGYRLFLCCSRCLRPAFAVVNWVLSGCVWLVKRRCVEPLSSVSARVQVSSWERLLIAALRLISRRRRISLAFERGDSASLRQAEGSRPSQARLNRGGLPRLQLRHTRGLCGLWRKARASAMADPSAAELNALNNLVSIYDWAGFDGELLSALASALGVPTKIRDVVFVNRFTCDLTVGALTLPGAAATDPRVPVPPVQQGRVEVVRPVCLLRCGMPVDTLGAPSTASASGAGGAASGSGAQPGAMDPGSLGVLLGSPHGVLQPSRGFALQPSAVSQLVFAVWSRLYLAAIRVLLCSLRGFAWQPLAARCLVRQPSRGFALQPSAVSQLDVAAWSRFYLAAITVLLGSLRGFAWQPLARSVSCEAALTGFVLQPSAISQRVFAVWELSSWSNYSSAVDKPVDVEKLSDKARHPGFVVGFRTWRRPAKFGRKPVLNKLGLSAKLMGNGATHFALHGISRNPGRIWPARWESGPILFLQLSARQPRGGWAGPKPCYGCPCHFPIAWRKPAVEPLSSGRALTSKSLTGVKEFVPAGLGREVKSDSRGALGASLKLCSSFRALLGEAPDFGVKSRGSPSGSRIQDLRLDILGLRERCEAATSARRGLEDEFAEERRKFASEKLKVQVSLAKLVPEVEAAQQGSKAAASQSAVRRREASSSQAEQTSRVQALEDSLRGSKAQLAEANRRLELESSALDRVSSELGQHRGLASSVNENLDSELQRRREETGWQLEALTDQLSAARREVVVEYRRVAEYEDDLMEVWMIIRLRGGGKKAPPVTGDVMWYPHTRVAVHYPRLMSSRDRSY